MNRLVRASSLLRAWPCRGVTVELHVTPCIVTHPPGACDGLVNPANEQLQGTQFTPAEAERNLSGPGLIYPPQVIDGLVTELGGPGVWRACETLPKDQLGRRCAVGSAVITQAHGELLCSYRHIVHAVAPHYGDARWASLLRGAYASALSVASHAHLSTLAVPLLGSGARGAPPQEVRTRSPHATHNTEAGTLLFTTDR